MLPADPTLSVAERVDAACDRFEAEWKADRKPRIDDFLAAAPESDREDLRQALLALKLELQGRSEADTSVSRSSVRSGDKPAPEVTVDQIQNVEPSVGKVGRFEIRGVLGSGAFGKVYRAFDPHLSREVAVKVPLESTVRTDKERSQFLKEARSAANINHPNICQVHEVGEADGRPYIVMALVRGLSLADTLKARKEPLPEKQAALVVRKIALALAAAHDSRIVHRDLKPANVMFDRERKDIVVMDFGLARAPGLGDARGTQSGVIMGTPAYMSPEQARGDSKGVGPAGDIFSLGVILYELLTGKRPFTGTATEVIGKILHVEAEKPSAVRPSVDPRLEAICLKAMAKDTAARFASMKEFAQAIDTVLRQPAPAGPSVETAKANTTRRQGKDESTSTRNNLAEVFAVLSDDRKQARVETAAAVEAAIAKHRTPRWVFLLVGLLFVGGMAALAGVVFFTRSDKVKVDLAVIINDVDMKDKSLSFFLDAEPIAADVLATPVELKPGVHIFTVKRGKEIVKRVEIRVEGGRNPSIKVEDITPPPTERPPSVSDDLARWQGTWRCIEASMSEKHSSPEQLKYSGHYLFINGKSRLLQSPANDKQVNNWRGTIELSADHHFDSDDFRLDTGENTFRQSGLYEFTGDKLRMIYRLGQAGMPLERANWNDRGKKGVIYFEYRRLTPADDQALWQGKWRCVGEKSHGAARTPDELKTSGRVMEVSDDRLVIERTLGGTLGQYTGTFRIDPKSSPRQFDWEGTGPAGAKIRLSGVYEFTGDRLRFIYRNFLADTQQPRATWADEKQPSVVWLEFERVTANDGFVPLFNGKDLTGWEAPTQPEAFRVTADGRLIAKSTTPESAMHWLYTKKEFADYVLRLEFRFVVDPPEDTFAGITPRSEIDSSMARRAMRIKIPLRAQGGKPYSGAVYYAMWDAADPKPPLVGLASGVWHTLELEARSQRIKIVIDGTTVNDVDLGTIDRKRLAPDQRWAETELDRTTGHIGIHASLNPTEFRNIRVKEIPPQKADVGFVPLFNGKDLSGWKSTAGDSHKWQVANGGVRCSGPTDYLYTDRGDFEDFHLRFEAKVNNTGNGGVYFRSQVPLVASGKSDGHFEAQITTREDQPKTGSLFGLVKVTDVLVPPDKWFTYEIIAVGNRIRLLVNGKETADYTDTLSQRPRKGHIALQCWKHQNENTEVAYRNVEIKEFGFVPLFNGKDLTGWKTHESQPGNWKVVDGVIVCGSDGTGPTHLYSARDDYKDFHLRMDVRLKDGSTGAMYRAPFGPTLGIKKEWVAGYNAKFDATRRGGIIVDQDRVLHRIREIDVKDGEWAKFEIIARGNRHIVKLNGETTADYTDPDPRYRSGHIVLQKHGTKAEVAFRNIEIKDLAKE